MYRLYRKQVLSTSIEVVWDFLANPKNLEVITPRDMGFQIKSGADRAMFEGQIIQYSVKPMLGIPVQWTTEITHLQKPYYFVDEQRMGPYKFWHHKHFLKPMEGGVQMEDEIHYELPMQPLGGLMHPWVVRPRLNEIFEYRRKALVQIFGQTTDNKEAV